MRKLLLFTALTVLGAWLALWAGSAIMRRVQTRGSGHQWPLGLGTLSDAKSRYPDAATSPAAVELIDRTARLGIDIGPRHFEPQRPPRQDPFQQIRRDTGDYVTSQIHKPQPDIDAPIGLLGDYLAGHGADLAAIRTLLASDKPISWTVDFDAGARAPMPNLLGHVQLARLLHASALERARVGDRGAWQDLQASLALSASLWKRPELISALIALAISRSAHAVARKLPLPEPEWFGETRKFDYVRAALAAQQAETASIVDRVYEEGAEHDSNSPQRPWTRVTEFVLRPYYRLSATDLAEAERHVASRVASNRACDFLPDQLARVRNNAVAWWNYPAQQVDLRSVNAVWQRVFRHRAEMEATERALRLRAGLPPLPKSWCSDGQWVYEGAGFRFSREFAKPPVAAAAIPVEFVIP